MWLKLAGENDLAGWSYVKIMTSALGDVQSACSISLVQGLHTEINYGASKILKSHSQ